MTQPSIVCQPDRIEAGAPSGGGGEVSDVTISIHVDVRISFWQALKLRLAGAEAFRVLAEEMVRKAREEA